MTELPPVKEKAAITPVQKRVKDYFDHVASKDLYSSRNVFYSSFFEERDKHIADALRNMGLNRFRILDAGCGDGSGFIRIRERLKGLNIVYKGFDISLQMLGEARKRNLDVSEGDLVDLRDYCDGNFDIVLSLFGSIGYLSNEQERKSALGEFRRVLTEGGLLLLDVFYRDKERDCTYSLEDNNSIEGWIHLFRKGQVGELLEAEGFTIIDSSNFKTVFPNRRTGPKDNLHELYICRK